VRGAAARILHVINLGELEGAVRGASSVETDPSVAREMARAILSLSRQFDARGPVPVRPEQGQTPEARASVELPSEAEAGEIRGTMRTLADLPAGFTGAVLGAAGCEMPDDARVGVARVAYHHGLRPAEIELVRVPFTRECREAVTLLLRAGLRPDHSLDEPGAWHTLYVVLGKGLEERFDELPPSEAARPPDDQLVPPERTVFAKPAYPESMRTIQAEGKVILEAIVDGRGVPGSIRFLRSAGIAFDESAVLSVSQWRYQPATLGGRPLPVYLTFIIDYHCK
jgi:TonB family protein